MKNDWYPLPPDYPDLGLAAQKQARLAVLRDQSTPQRLVEAWELFRNLYLRPCGKEFYRGIWAPSPQFHYQMIYDLGMYGRNAQAAPRGTAKSFVIGLEVPLLLLLTRPYVRIVLTLATEKLVQGRFDLIIQQLTRNKLILSDFGAQRPAKGSGSWNHSRLQLLNGSLLEGFAVMGRKRGARPDLFILDDPEFDPESTGEEALMLIQEKFDNFLFRQVIPMLEFGSALFWIGTMINRRAALWRACTSDDPKFQVWNRRIYRAIERDPQNPAKVKLLWPEKWPEPVLEARRLEIGPAAFCFVADTQIHTPLGPRAIQHLRIGDTVYDGDHNPIQIKDQGSRTVTELTHIRIQGCDRPHVSSTDHPYLIYRPPIYRSKPVTHLSAPTTGQGFPAHVPLPDPTWIEAANIRPGDYCVYAPSKTESEPEIQDEEYWWFVGRYLAEGSYHWDDKTHHYCVQIVAGPNEKHLLTRSSKWLETTPWSGLKGQRRVHPKDQCWQLCVGSKDLTKRIAAFGKGAASKRLTSEAKQLPYKYFTALWYGYLSGDGFIHRDRRCVNSVSRQLLLDFRESFARFGIGSYLSRIKGYHTETIDGRTVLCRPLYNLQVYRNTGRRPKIYFHNGLMYSRVRTVETTSLNEAVPVYDITTNGSFLIDGAIVHNSGEYLNEPISESDRLLTVDEKLNEYTIPSLDIPAFTSDSSRVPITLTDTVHWHARDPGTGSYVPQKGSVQDLFGPMFRVLCVDYATGLTSRHDYKCILVAGFDSTNCLWHLDLWLKRTTDEELFARIFQYGLKWRVRIIGIEACGGQKALVDAMDTYMDRHALDAPDWSPRVLPIKYPSNTKKGRRISSALQWRFVNGKIKLPAHLRTTFPFSELYSQIADFTEDLGMLPNDDAIDTLAMTQYVVHSRGSKPTEPAREPTLTERIVESNPVLPGLPLLSGVSSAEVTPEVANALLDRAYKNIHNRRRQRPTLRSRTRRLR